ncbi:MAG TPA: adenylate/guanylate cyclase domain-containing protein, partial [Candidatus Acidoferrales bacterium]|nr:adenylate/guanylate cyclase domain-containing protein [Candidatus Acidoferrales bacterium]
HEAFVAAGRGAEADQLLEAAAGGPYQDAFYHRMRGRSVVGAGAREEAEAAFRLALKGFEDAGYRLEAIRTRLLLAEVIRDEAMRDSARSQARALGAWLLAGEPLPEAGIAVRHGGERLVTVLFADVRGYTELARRQAPAELADQVAAFQRWAKQEVERHHGLLDKFAGDAVMATFNAGGARLDHCTQAVQAALALSAKAAALDLQVGCGIAVGPAVVGELAEGANPSVLGEATNLASRLQAAAEAGELLLSDEAYRRVAEYLGGQGLEAAPRELSLKGFDEPVKPYGVKT